MRSSRIIGTALAVFAFAAPAVASPITYTEAVTGSGTLNGTAFTNQLVVITMPGDTNNIVMTPPHTFVNPPNTTATATVTVAGVTDTLPNILVELDKDASEVGFITLIAGEAVGETFGLLATPAPSV